MNNARLILCFSDSYEYSLKSIDYYHYMFIANIILILETFYDNCSEILL